MNKLIRLETISALGLLLGACGGPSEPATEIDQTLDGTARALAADLASADVRLRLQKALLARSTGDYEVLYRDLVSSELESTASIEMPRIAEEQAGALATLPRVHFAMPAHAKTWDAAEVVPLVAVVPSDVPEEEITSLVAYDADGRVHMLDPNEAPERPVVVVALNERVDDDGVLRVTKAEPIEGELPNEEPTSPLFQTIALPYLLGIPNVMILNDHEPWYLGSPEIYVKIRRWLVPSGVFQDTRVNLTQVNNEDVWYNLGDPNATYVRVGAGYDDTVEITFYEEDTGGDDFVGLFLPHPSQIPTGGFVDGTPLGTTRDARIRLDRDSTGVVIAP